VKTKTIGGKMEGFVFRCGVRVKNFGERLSHIKVRGVFILSWLGSSIINIGNGIKRLA